MISKIQAVQPWLKQFAKSHRKVAESLLDSLIYIKTSSVIYDLKEEILQNEGVKKFLFCLLESYLPMRVFTILLITQSRQRYRSRKNP